MNDVLTVTEVAEYLRIHRTSVYKLIRRSGIPYFKVGTDYRFRRDAIDDWMKKQTEER